MQCGLELEHNNVLDEDDPAAAWTNAKSGHPETSQLYTPSVPYSSGFTPFSLLLPHSGLKYSVADPCANIYSDGISLTSADDSLALSNLLFGAPVVSSESLGLLSQHPPYGNLQLWETIQYQYSQDNWVQTLGAPEVPVWTAVAQPVISVHDSQCLIYFLTPINLHKIEMEHANDPPNCRSNASQNRPHIYPTINLHSASLPSTIAAESGSTTPALC